MATKTTNLLANLPQDLIIGKAIQHDHSIELPVTPPKVVPVCPHCHSAGCISKGSDGFKSVRHTPCGNTGVFLTFKKLRFYCPRCCSSFTCQYTWQHGSLPITNNLYLSIVADLSEMIPIPQIAKNNCVTDNIVRGVLKSIDIPPCSILPETLCVDDFKGNCGVYNPDRKKWDTIRFQTCVVDGDNGMIIDVLKDRTSATVTSYFKHFSETQRDNVKYFCCDMSGIYASVARKVFPNADLCVDKFHVVQWLNRSVDLVRRRLQNDFRNTPEKYDKLKNSQLMLLTKECNQELYWSRSGYTEKLSRLNSLLKEFPDLSEAFDALQEYHFVCEADSNPIRRLRLLDWINKYSSSEVPEVRAAAKTVKNWKKNILNSFEFGVSNASAEALNNQIKRLKKVACGFHDFENFRKRILLNYGTMKFIYDQYTIFGEKRTKRTPV